MIPFSVFFLLTGFGITRIDIKDMSFLVYHLVYYFTFKLFVSNKDELTCFFLSLAIVVSEITVVI